MKPKNESAEQEFLSFMATASKTNGLDDLSAKIVSILYLEPQEVALEDLAAHTGYSLASVSTIMKFMERGGIAKRMKKPGSRKAYFYMPKDILGMARDHLRSKYHNVVQKGQKVLPGIVERYEKQAKTKEEKEKLVIMQNYLCQIKKIDKVMEQMLKELEKV